MVKLLTLLFATLAALHAQADRFGLPACKAAHEELADRTYFIICHNALTKTPTWVAYELTPGHLNGAARRPSHFRADHQLAQPGSTNADYTNSGYSRGHLAPARDFAYSDDAIRATFLLSNAAPQNQSMNSGAWAQLERAVRQQAENADAVYVVTGPLFPNQPETIGPNHVAVPTAFFKAILIVKNTHSNAYATIIPNRPTPESFSAFETTITILKHTTGLHFFPKLEN